jgi:hypothetical protein
MSKKVKSLHGAAATKAKQYLIEKYSAEYKAMYRAQVIALGGKCHPSNDERIARLKAEIAKLEASK